MLASLLLSAVLAQTLPQGARGAAFFVRDDGDAVVLKLRFGERELDQRPSPPDEAKQWKWRVPVKLAAPISLFDSKGQLVAVGTPKFTYLLTCENDGGLQGQAIAEVRVLKSQLKRPLKKWPKGWNVVALAVVGRVEKATPLESEDVAYVKADLDGDGKVDAMLAGGPDEAMNCGEKKGAHWSVNLYVGDDTTWLRCCGP